MPVQTIILILFILLVAGMMVRKMLLSKKIRQYDGASVEDKLKARENIVLLDVRTSQERSRRRIDGSVHVPLQELRSRLGELEKFKGREIICYCASGNRSLNAALILHRSGFNAANLSGGMSGWNS
jgi:rhodanese-related sulfurtransferase